MSSAFARSAIMRPTSWIGIPIPALWERSNFS